MRLALAVSLVPGALATGSFGCGDDSAESDRRPEVAEAACARIMECMPSEGPDTCVEDYLAGLEDESDVCVDAIGRVNDCLSMLACNADGNEQCGEEIDRGNAEGCEISI